MPDTNWTEIEAIAVVASILVTQLAAAWKDIKKSIQKTADDNQETREMLSAKFSAFEEVHKEHGRRLDRHDDELGVLRADVVQTKVKVATVLRQKGSARP